MFSNNLYKTILIGFISLFIIAASVFLWNRAWNLDNELGQAYTSYTQGEQAKTIAERKIGFNNALKIYLQLESRYDPAFGNGKLYYNIGNTYFQLEEYPWAALYYYRALELMPRDEKVKHNLQIAQTKLGITAPSSDTIFKKIFFFHHYFSVPERLVVFFIFALLTLLVISLNIWVPKRWMKSAIFLLSASTAIMFLSIAYWRYLTPVEAVVVKSSAIYRDAGEQYAKVADKPVLSGVKVQVLDILNGGTWLKIVTPDGTLGYVPNQSVRII